LGLLLSDQCKHTIKVAVFANKANTIFKGREEFSGSLLKQIDDAFKYIELSNNTQSVIGGLVRQDYPDYPTDALREAFLNAVIHRNYDFSGSIMVNINSEFIEFVSIGGLLHGLSETDIRLGVSQLRNEKLSQLFLRLNIIEAYGTGIKRIFDLYEGHFELPQIDVGPNAFRIRIPNMNKNRNIVMENRATYNAFAPRRTNVDPITEQEKLILEYLKEYNEITDEKVQELLDVKKTRAFVITKKMSDNGLVKITGRGVNRRITL
jgi:ATP-dependent DNA helicase RecG